MQQLTPMQEKIHRILSDGYRHSPLELMEVCKPSGLNAVQVHICNIRKVLNPQGIDIVCVFRDRKRFYQMVRLMGSMYE